MATGTVKRFNATTGYGFIQPDDGTRDVFVHHISAVERAGMDALKEGQKVHYEIQMSQKNGKISAENLRLVQLRARSCASGGRVASGRDASAHLRP